MLYKQHSASRRAKLTAVAVAAISILTFATCKLNDLITPPVPTQATAPKVKLSGPTTLFLGGTGQLTSAVTAGSSTVDGSQYTIEWSSSDPTKVSVDATTGALTGVATGQGLITARIRTPQLSDDQIVQDTARVRVYYKGIKVQALDSLRAVGATRTLDVRGVNNGGTVLASSLSAGLKFVSRDTNTV